MFSTHTVSDLWNPLRKLVFFSCAVALAAFAGNSSATPTTSTNDTIVAHAIALHGDIKYPADFQHFEYVSATAPKGGTLRLAGIVSSFDSLNPYITRGTAPRYASIIYDTLMVSSADEPMTQYGLIAERVEYPEDRSWIIFHLNPAARFHDGKNIRASDVVFSFNILMEKGSPIFSQYFTDIDQVTALDERRVKFTLKNTENRELLMIAGQVPVLPEHYWQGREFDRTSLDIPLGSGPYRIDRVDPGRSITYARVENYWAKDLPVMVGMYNFDRIQVEYFRDQTVAIEALKAGQIDFRYENIARSWHNNYNIPAANRGELVKQVIRDHSSRGMQAFIMNLRRPPFDNIYFRRAMNYAFDYEWTNHNLFHGDYVRNDSFFSNSELASSGLPTGRELEILTPFKNELPASVFSEAYSNPVTDGSGNNRQNLRKAQELLREAGFRVANGRLIDPATQQQVTIEFMLRDSSFERIINPYVQNLRRLGIEASVRLVDISQYINRMQNRDFDITTHVISQSQSPGNEQRDLWSSRSAEIEGSSNYSGIKNPVVDKLVELLVNAETREELVIRARALDRVLLHNHYVVPQWNLVYNRLVHWDIFGQPEISPRYDFQFNTGIFTWWIEPEKAQRLGRRQQPTQQP